MTTTAKSGEKVIPPPHFDAALRGMKLALDGEAMADLLTRQLGRCDRRNSAVASCRPYYVKYQPGSRCLVQYDVELIDEHAEGSARTQAYVALHGRKRLEKLISRHDLYRRDKWEPAARPRYIDEVQGIACFHPVDVGMPRLAEAACRETMTDRLRSSTGAGPEILSVELIRYRAEKRAVLKYKLDGVLSGNVFGKIRSGPERSLAHASRAFRRAGVPSPETVATFADLGMIVQAEAAGARLKDLRGTSAYVGWMPAVADALARLHAASDRILPRQSIDTEMSELLTAARTIGRLLPHLEQETRRLTSSLLPKLAAMRPGSSTIHGSFHDDQVLVGDAGVVFIDLDSAMVGNPLSDVAHFASYLSADGEQEACDAFLDSYAGARSDDVAELEAAALLRWAELPFRELRPDWREAVESRVLLAADRLSSAADRLSHR